MTKKDEDDDTNTMIGELMRVLSLVYITKRKIISIVVENLLFRYLAKLERTEFF